MNIQGIYQNAVFRLRAAGIEDAPIDAGIMLSHLLKCSRTELFLTDRETPPVMVEGFERMMARRLKREPVAYIIGEQEFWSLPFMVTPAVLIPRPETERVIEAVLAVKEESGLPAGPVLDLGTGSGVLAVCLALELPDRQVVAVDCSLPALRVAAANAGRHEVSERLHLVNTCWFAGLDARPIFSLVVANPPYVAAETLASLQPEVRDFEPIQALDGGPRGVREIERISRHLYQVLQVGGWYFMEIGFDQEEHVLALFKDLQIYDHVRVLRDYAGLPRVLQARRARPAWP